MSNKIKDITKQNIIYYIKQKILQNYTYYFFDDIINITNFDANEIKIENIKIFLFTTLDM